MFQKKLFLSILKKPQPDITRLIVKLFAAAFSNGLYYWARSRFITRHMLHTQYYSGERENMGGCCIDLILSWYVRKNWENIRFCDWQRVNRFARIVWRNLFHVFFYAPPSRPKGPMRSLVAPVFLLLDIAKQHTFQLKKNWRKRRKSVTRSVH